MLSRALLALMVATMFVAPIIAHDHVRPDLDGWYSGLKSHKGPCCGDPSEDAKTLDGPEWKIVGGNDGHSPHYEVYLEGEWRVVPDDAVITEPNMDGRALVWPIYYRSFGAPVRIEIRCFMPGSLT